MVPESPAGKNGNGDSKKLMDYIILVGIHELCERLGHDPSNKELSEHLNFSEQQTSIYVRKMLDGGFVKQKNDEMDYRTRRLYLMPEGEAQVWLIKASLAVFPGEDKLAVAITKAMKKLLSGSGAIK